MKIGAGKIIGAALFAAGVAAIWLWPKAKVEAKEEDVVRPVRSMVVTGRVKLPEIRCPGRVRAGESRDMMFEVSGRLVQFKLDTDEDVKTVKNTIKREMVADLNKKLQDKNEKSMTGLSTGLMPQSIREYGVGYVTFHGAPIPTARLGTIFPQLAGESNTPERKGYAEFLETKFDAKHKKMRQMVSFACGMADGLGGTIDSLFEHGGEKSNIQGAPRDNCTGNGTVVTSVGLRPDENYNIEIGDNGDVKITLTHFIQNKVVNLFGENGVYVPSFFSSESDAPVVAGAKITATMTIRNASDAELGEGMPEFTIDNIIQEEMN